MDIQEVGCEGMNWIELAQAPLILTLVVAGIMNSDCIKNLYQQSSLIYNYM
jgi:hypothetical protein